MPYMLTLSEGCRRGGTVRQEPAAPPGLPAQQVGQVHHQEGLNRNLLIIKRVM